MSFPIPMENSSAISCPSTPRWNSERPFLTGRFHQVPLMFCTSVFSVRFANASSKFSFLFQETKTTSRFFDTKGYSVDSLG